MNKTLKIITLLSAVLFFAACEETPSGSSDPVNSREIVYTLNSKVVRTTLMTDTEWDALLDQFCRYTQEGQTVSFYNSHLPATGAKSAPGAKEATTISTTSREEMKTWMREMELAGKTVTVTYDSETGRWNGTAYANGAQGSAQRDLDRTSVVGRWHYYSMTSYSLVVRDNDLAGEWQTVTPESVGNSIYFDLREDGTMSYQRGTADGGSLQTLEGTWSLSDDSRICCEYFDGNTCWTVGCVTNGIMVLYAIPTETTAEIFYTMELHAVR